MALLTRKIFNGSISSFEAQLQYSLIAFGWGSATPTFTRATAAYQTDFEGKQNLALSGEARFQGARRVRNLTPNSETITDAAGWSTSGASIASGAVDPLGGTSAFTVTATVTDGQLCKALTTVVGDQLLQSVWIKRRTGTGQIKALSISGSPGNVLPVTSSWQRLSDAVLTATGTLSFPGLDIVSSGDAIDIWHPMWENVVGQTNQNPSEYVSVGVLSAPYHGAGVDGVQYFNTLNGNTVASNVVTEATGAAITSAQAAAAGGVTAGVVDASGPLGYLAEGVRINYLLNSGTPATQTTASLATGTYTLWQTGTGSSTSSADTATITGGGAATAGSPNVFVVTVAGTVTVTVAGSPTTFQLENGAFASSYIPTTTVAVQRNADMLTYPSAGNISGTQGVAYGEITTGYPSPAGEAGRFLSSYPAADFILGASSTFFSIYDGTAWNGSGTYLYSSITPIKSAGAWGGSTTQTAQSGIVSATAAFDGNVGVGTLFAVGNQTDGNASLFGTIRNVRIYPTALSVAKLQVMTT